MTNVTTGISTRTYRASPGGVETGSPANVDPTGGQVTSYEAPREQVDHDPARNAGPAHQNPLSKPKAGKRGRK